MISAGSGFVLGNYLRFWREKGVRPQAFALERNPDACAFATDFFKAIDVSCTVVQCDFCSPPPLPPVDVLLFNPPYVATSAEELAAARAEAGAALAWAGGTDGAEVIATALPPLLDLLSPSGVLYLLLIDANDPWKLLTRFRLQGQLLSRQQAFNEVINIYRVCKPRRYN